MVENSNYMIIFEPSYTTTLRQDINTAYDVRL